MRRAVWPQQRYWSNVPFVRAFLAHRFGMGEVILSALCVGDVVGFVQHQAPGMNRKRAKLMTTALRSFLHYVRYRDEGMPDLAAGVPVVANWSMDSVPRAISTDQVQRLLTSVDRSTVMGRRDYAILLLLARLGLRSSEVAFLEPTCPVVWRKYSVRGVPCSAPPVRQFAWHFVTVRSHLVRR